MERKCAVKKAGADAAASAETSGDPLTQGEEAALQPKPRPSERTWQGLLVYSRKALYKKKSSLQCPRLKRRKSRRSLLLPQNQLVAIKNSENWTVTFCKMPWYYPTKDIPWKLLSHSKTCFGWHMRCLWPAPFPGPSDHPHQVLHRQEWFAWSIWAEAATSNWASWPQPRTHRKFITTSTKVAISKVKIRKLPTDASFKKKQLCMSGTRKERSSTWRRTS